MKKNNEDFSISIEELEIVETCIFYETEETKKRKIIWYYVVKKNCLEDIFFGITLCEKIDQIKENVPYIQKRFNLKNYFNIKDNIIDTRKLFGMVQELNFY